MRSITYVCSLHVIYWTEFLLRSVVRAHIAIYCYLVSDAARGIRFKIHNPIRAMCFRHRCSSIVFSSNRRCNGLGCHNTHLPPSHATLRRCLQLRNGSWRDGWVGQVSQVKKCAHFETECAKNIKWRDPRSWYYFFCIMTSEMIFSWWFVEPMNVKICLFACLLTIFLTKLHPSARCFTSS